MSTVPSRNPWVLVFSVFASFAAGPALGIAVAHWTAPASEVAQVVSPFAFALAFTGGLMLWFGIGVVGAVARGLYRLARGGSDARVRAVVHVPSGYGAFVPLGLGSGLLAGSIAGLVPQAPSFWFACAAHVAAGGAYGGSLYALARHGYLPFPEPS